MTNANRRHERKEPPTPQEQPSGVVVPNKEEVEGKVGVVEEVDNSLDVRSLVLPPSEIHDGLLFRKVG
jgi:hypothetical protein